MPADLSPQDRRALRKIAERLARVEKEQKRANRTAQGAYRSLEGGSYDVYDADGVLRSVIGEQADGTVTRIDLNAPAPTQPAEPVVDGRAGVLVVSSYGLAADLSDWPLDFARLDVHVGAPGFVPSPASKVAEFTDPNGGAVTLALDAGTYEAVLIAVNTSGTESVPSAAVADIVTSPSVGAGGVTTYHTDDEPIGLDADDDGALWYDTNAGNLAHRWNGPGLAWVPMPLGADALTVLREVSIEGASVSIGSSEAGSIAEPFAGTTLPAGWTTTKTGTGAANVPGASVVNAGIPAGGSGSALLIDYGPGGGTNNAAVGTVVPNLGNASDAEVEVRFRHENATAATVGPEFYLAIRRQGGAAGSSTEDAVVFSLDHRAPGAFFPYTVASRVNASDSPLLTFTLDTDTATDWHIAKLRIVAGQIEAKLWRDGDPEPEWSNTQQTGVLTEGEVALVWEQTGDPTFPSLAQRTWVDYVNVTTYSSGLTVNPDGSGKWPAIEGPLEARLDDLELDVPALEARVDTLEAPGTWHTLGTAGEPAFQNGYTDNAAAGEPPASFRLDPFGRVRFRGRIDGGTTNTTAFTLPVGYRPPFDLLNMTALSGGIDLARIDVYANGQVQARFTTANAISLNSVSFDTT